MKIGKFDPPLIHPNHRKPYVLRRSAAGIGNCGLMEWFELVLRFEVSN